MHSIAPYSIRCFNPFSAKDPAKRYALLDKVGASDMYEIFKAYLAAQDEKFKIIDRTQQVYRFIGVKFYDDAREIAGWFEAGTYGVKSDIIDIATGAVDYEKAQHNAEIIKHYVRISLPKGVDEGVALLHNFKGNGIKTMLYDLLREHFNKVTKMVLHMNPLAYEVAFKQWENAYAKEIKLTRFSGVPDITDQLNSLGHKEQQLVIKAPVRGSLGKLQDFFTKDTKEKTVVEFFAPMCEQVKAVFEMDGKRRTFNIGRPSSEQFCEIPLEDGDVTMIAGNPDPHEMHKFCTTVLDDLARSIYPGMIG